MAEKDLSGSLDALMVDEKDNVAVCLHNLDEGTEAAVRLGKENFPVTTAGAIPRGHKIAINDIAQGEKIIKYGEIIGQATEDIAKGNHVHVHNVTD
ncbi:MAG TPA: flagellar biosynthesis protein FlgA [Rhodospirillaceae bacterium]|nr:flagellar biosynthesis protein FlgA [Rhodospirillaceae bacterium]HAA93961.1 flagellar biosynthesis protein FlgA [Rhodospirillaceae bacterium]HAT34089.1 flagellar biosynthesis protein FlgA [Rhodospirillaceae bacterium]